MSTFTIFLQFNKTYHIYNRGINSCDIFQTENDYEHFLALFRRYIPPVAHCYSWALLKNHFHMVIKIKDELEILRYQKIHGALPLQGINRISKQFSNLFNAYARYYNIKHERTGGLFESNFRRIEIDSPRYLKQVILYIHNNPVKHKFCNHPLDYPWTSYSSYLSQDNHLLYPDNILNLFLDFQEYKNLHKEQLENDAFGVDLEY